MKRVFLLSVFTMFILGCSQNKNISASQVIGGAGGAALGGMVGGMLGMLVTGGQKDKRGVLVGFLVLGAAAGGSTGVALGTGVQTVIENK